MAKKKPISRIIIAGAGIGVLVAVIVPVMLFVFGIGIGNILAQDTDPDQFEIPITVEEEMMNEEIIEEIEEIVEGCDNFITNENNIPVCVDPEPQDPILCQLSQSELQQIAECQVLTEDEQFVNVQDNQLGTSLEECSLAPVESANECALEVEQIIQDLYDNLVIPDPPTNQTMTSIDDPFTQLCDQDPTLIICGDSRSLELLTRVLKTDSAGVQTTVETTFDIPLASLFVEDTTNVDFRTGQLQFEVQVKGDPDFRYVGTGMVDLLIGQQSIFTNPIEVKVDGIADEEGKVDLLFVSPTGATSDLILFDFEQNFDSFNNEEVTPVRLNVVELNIAGERDQDFAMVDQDVFTMDIFRDDIQILITDEQGIESRVYPSDSILQINTVSSKTDPVNTGLTRVRIYVSDFLGNGVGCTQHYLHSDTSYTPSMSTRLTIPAPTIGQVQIKDLEGNVVHTDAGGSGTRAVDFRELTRNQNYTVTISNPLINSAPIEYGKSQETNAFTCTQEGTPILASSTQTIGSFSPCSSVTYRTYTSASQVNLGAISCNLPEVP